MATKAEYLAALAGKDYIQKVGVSVFQPNASDADLELNVYRVPVLENVGNEKAQIVKQVYSVYREGLGGETAFGPYTPFFKENDNVYQLIVTYVSSSISNVKSYWIKEYSKDENYAKVRAYVFETDHIEEKWFLIWSDGGLTHEEITVTV